MSSSDGAGGSYPSPKQAQGLPFYQDRSQQQSQTHIDSREDGQVRSPGSHDDLSREVSGGTRIRANYMGSFGAFEALPGDVIIDEEMAAAATLPQGPLGFQSPDNMSPVHLPESERNKDRRTKVSRACDECRRKKIRCDVADESGSPCSNCVRTGATCAFSRQPLKRGPSRGYIRHLTDRVNTLEQQQHMQQEHRFDMQHVMNDGLQPFQSDVRLLVEPRPGDKRSHDMAEALNNSQSHMFMPSTNGHLHALPTAQHSLPNTNQPFWRQGHNDHRQDTVGLAFDAEPSVTVTSFDWDEEVVDEYYRLIHQTFPLLPNNKNRLRQRLGECPASLRDAFLIALDCLMRTFPTTTLPPNVEYPQALKRAAELIAKYPFDKPSSHTTATNLLYLQTLLLMALESDNHGPATIRGQAGPSRAEWLGRAAGVAGQLEINAIRTTNQSVIEGDRDSEERLARRVWWVLFILDRWHASSTADLLKLPENSVVLLPEDQILLGESTYHLARLSFIIGHLAAILTTTKTPSTDVMSPSNPASSLLGLTLAGEIDRFRESVESVWGSLNLVHLSYHHCHLLIKRLSPTTEPTELVGHAVKVATVLNSRLTPVTPLNHHFGALAAMTLCELCDVSKTRAEALKGLDHMIECLGEGRGLAGKLESEGWDGAVRELVKKKKEQMQRADNGLHNLSNAALGHRDAKFDPTKFTRYGYLVSLGQGVFARDNM